MVACNAFKQFVESVLEDCFSKLLFFFISGAVVPKKSKSDSLCLSFIHTLIGGAGGWNFRLHLGKALFLEIRGAYYHLSVLEKSCSEEIC